MTEACAPWSPINGRDWRPPATPAALSKPGDPQSLPAGPKVTVTMQPTGRVSGTTVGTGITVAPACGSATGDTASRAAAMSTSTTRTAATRHLPAVFRTHYGDTLHITMMEVELRRNDPARCTNRGLARSAGTSPTVR